MSLFSRTAPCLGIRPCEGIYFVSIEEPSVVHLLALQLAQSAKPLNGLWVNAKVGSGFRGRQEIVEGRQQLTPYFIYSASVVIIGPMGVLVIL